MKILGFGEVLSDEARSDNLVVQSHEAAIRLLRKNDFRYTGHDCRIKESGQYREDEHQAKSRSNFIDHKFRLLRQTQRDDELVDGPNTREGDNDSTESVN